MIDTDDNDANKGTGTDDAQDKSTLDITTDEVQPLTVHLKELRNRMAIVLIGLFTALVIAYPVSASIVQMVWDNFVPSGIDMSVYSPLEWIFARFKLSIVFAVAVTIPLFLYEIFRFAARGLYQNEKRFFIKVVPASFLLFILGSCIAYFLALPLMFKYIIFYSSDIAIAQISVAETISIVTMLVLGFGLVFQLPLLVIFAIKMGIVKYETLKKQRFIVYAALVGFSMFMSPDPTFIAQLLTAVVLIVLFELSIAMAKVF
ncbi:MAG: twin-arginine translocase subunit TatC [Methanosarcinaceae archaeon]|nr:twin-arginine translocase subunit TatC [Methanosarcinaceae archaeon]MDF1533172.1 twin-arginine translocase subunit TatC [Methanosarcinaceae archaeon]